MWTFADGPDDSEELRYQKRTQLAMAVASLPLISLIGLVEASAHGPRALAFPGIYVVGTAAMLAALAATRRYDVFRWAHPVWVFVLPWAEQEAVGGFVASGGVGLWGVCAVTSVPMFVGSRFAGWGVAAYAVAAAASVIADVMRGDFASRAAVAWLFAVNSFGVSVFLLASVQSFVGLLARERRTSERLLLNVLPATVARRLKADRRTIADRHEDAAVLFSDLVGFTALSARMSPESLVELLDAVFRAFDAEVDALGLEKIKTIGDAYMVVGGVPRARPDAAEAVATLALRMRDALARCCAERGVALTMRTGIHVGPVVAGVIGTRKFAYDLWGDTVNTASRMESSGEAGRVHVSEAAAERLRGAFELEDRGVIEVKGKGPMRTAWLGAPIAVTGSGPAGRT